MKTRDTRLCSAMLIVFLVLGWVVSSNRALPDILSTSATALVNIAGIILGPVALYFAFKSRPDRHRPLSLRMKNYLWFGLFLVIALLVYGLIAGNANRAIVLDILALAPLLGGLLLGTDDEVWSLITPPVWILTMLAIGLGVTLTDSRILQDRSIINHETGTAFETLLTVLPVVAAMHASRKRTNWYFPMAFACFGILFVYLYFGRRGITLRATLEIVVVCVVAPLLARTNTRVVVSALAVMVFATGLLLYFPFDLLIDRYRGDSGVVSTVTDQNERWYEAGLLLDELNAAELFVGRGLGGAFSVGVDNGFYQDIIQGDRTGKVGTHAGAFWPVLKGGVCFALFYFVPCLFLFLGLASIRQLDPITRGAVLIAPIWFAFQFLDGSISYSQPWMGFGTGLLLSRFDRIGGRARVAVAWRVVQSVPQSAPPELAPVGAAR
jgi:hypothetical protein